MVSWVSAGIRSPAAAARSKPAATAGGGRAAGGWAAGSPGGRVAVRSGANGQNAAAHHDAVRAEEALVVLAARIWPRLQHVEARRTAAAAQHAPGH